MKYSRKRKKKSITNIITKFDSYHSDAYNSESIQIIWKKHSRCTGERGKSGKVEKQLMFDMLKLGLQISTYIPVL